MYLHFIAVSLKVKGCLADGLNLLKYLSINLPKSMYINEKCLYFLLVSTLQKNRVNLICTNLYFTSLLLGLNLKAEKYLLQTEPDISAQFIEYGDLLAQCCVLDIKAF